MKLKPQDGCPIETTPGLGCDRRFELVLAILSKFERELSSRRGDSVWMADARPLLCELRKSINAEDGK